MGNNNATAISTEEESSKLDTNGMSPLGSVSLETTQDQVFVVGELRNGYGDGDKDKESSKLETNGMSPLDSVSLETTEDLAGEVRDGDREKDSSELETNGKSSSYSMSVETTHDGEEVEERESFPDGVEEAELQSKELVSELKVKMVEEEVHPSGLEIFVMENDEQLQKQISVAEGVELVCEATEVAELSIIGTQSVVNKLNMTESGNKEKLCVIDETVFVSPSFCETVGTGENIVNESLGEETALSEEVVKLDQETAIEQAIIGNEGFPEMESREFLKLDHRAVDDEEVTNEENSHKAISNLISQESNVIRETGRVYKEEMNMELEREAKMKRMVRCRSLPVSHSSRVMGDSLVQQLVLEVTFPLRTNMGLEKGKTSETPCEGSNKAQETTEARTESTKEAIEKRSPSFGKEQKIEERSNESTEKTPLLCQDKTEIYKTTIDVEEKTVMLKRSESVKTRGINESHELLKKQNNSFKETNGSGHNLLEKKASSESMKGVVKKRSKSLLLGTCLCCTTMN